MSIVGVFILTALAIVLVVLLWLVFGAWMRAEARRDALWDRVMDAIQDRYDETARAVSKALREPK